MNLPENLTEAGLLRQNNISWLLFLSVFVYMKHEARACRRRSHYHHSKARAGLDGNGNPGGRAEPLGNSTLTQKYAMTKILAFACHHLDPFALDFPRERIQLHSTRGAPFNAWVSTGMPRIPEYLLDCAFYLYRSQEAAQEGEQRGGTGFVVAIPSAVDVNAAHVYGVSAKHVVHGDDYAVMRVNTMDGQFDIFPYEPHEWIAHPSGDDVAVIPLYMSNIHRAIHIRDSLFAKEGSDIGPGDDVFMIGRFINHEGLQRNDPSVRFGNVSIGLTTIRLPTGHMQHSYAVEMRSMAGYSGSPVFCYRTPLSRMGGGPSRVTRRTDIWLLGLNWGYITDDWEIIRRTVAGPALRGGERRPEFVRANTGINGVVPAWKILEVLNLPRLQQIRADDDAEHQEVIARNRGGTEFAGGT